MQNLTRRVFATVLLASMISVCVIAEQSLIKSQTIPLTEPCNEPPHDGLGY